MADVIEFPNFDDQWSRVLDPQITEALRQGGYGHEVITWILSEWHARLKGCLPDGNSTNFVLPAGTPPTLPEQISAAIMAEREHGLRFAFNIAVQLLSAVIELSAARFSAAPRPSDKVTAQILKLVPGGKGDDAES